MTFHTKKLYYVDPFLSECTAEVLDIKNGNEICLSQTIAYPEGGGQISDTGIFFVDATQIFFDNVQKGYGRVLNVPDFPTVNVDTPVYHTVAPNYANDFVIGQQIRMKIDLERRIWTTLHHSAIHLVLMIASELRGNLYNRIKGCSITTEHARLDFSLPEKFTASEIEIINERLGQLIAEEIPVLVYPYHGENEAWFWKCKDYICPCGGTHITNTAQIGHAQVKRKGVGKGIERLVVAVDNPKLTASSYH